jgi:hypothetical protein
MGGKSRIARQIVQRIALDGSVQSWWEPFCGGLSVSVELVRAFGSGLLSDANPSLIALYRAIRGGWKPPETVTDDEWRTARNLPDGVPLKAFCGFALSYGGKWFDGRARDERAGRRPFEVRAAEALLRKVAAVRRCEIECVDFLSSDAHVDSGVIVYADPPYRGCKQNYGLGPFDSEAFWTRAKSLAITGTRLYVSEYQAPAPWRCIAEFHPGRGLNARSAQDGPVEKLWTHPTRTGRP